MNNNDVAFLTIGQLADELKLPQHILRYWEAKFPQLQPLTRAGNRRYYRPQDAELARQINHLLNVQGYTVKGVQKLLASGSKGQVPAAVPIAPAETVTVTQPTASRPSPHFVVQLEKLRDSLKNALQADDIAGLK